MEERDTSQWIVEEQVELSIDELGHACRCSRESIVALVREGVLQPTDATDVQAPEWRFRGQSLQRARRATRLQRELELNVPAVALVLQLLDRIDELEGQLRGGRSNAGR
ncbi:chaperone modulator CbpM [Azohydromonas australica]|uniref:chaperone modulator CbpM n=1 Tax=Azohydromonas australica TaxID=364039 RepID=UPI0004135586|nr:chaperone modulator CbpM [Azohydromonas australica]